MVKAAAGKESAGMDRAELKKHLRFAREEPVQVAFATGPDGKAVLQMHRRKPGRALEKELKDELPDSKSHRWGTASIDPDDAKLVRFTVNKAGGGMARKLIVALKGTGFNKVKILLDDGTELEAHEEADEEAPEDEENAPAAVAAPEAAETPTAAPAPEQETQPATPQPSEAQPNAEALKGELTALVKRMLAVIAKDPAQKAALAELATDAQASLKRGDLAQASAGIDILREAIEDAEAGASGRDTASADTAAPESQADTPPAYTPQADTPAGPAPNQQAAELVTALKTVVQQIMPMLGSVPGMADTVKQIVAQAQRSLQTGDLDTARGHLGTLQGMAERGPAPAEKAPEKLPPELAQLAPTIAKARQVWMATRKKVSDDVEKLHASVASAINGHGMAEQLVQSLRSEITAALDELDDSLADTLDQVNQASSVGDRQELVKQAQDVLRRYQAHVASDPVIAKLDNNPFLPLGIQKTVAASLATLSKVIR